MEKNESLSTLANIELGSPMARIHARGKFIDKDAFDFVPTPESVLLYIDTPNYDGPLDLLLHLIRKHSMDIFDIPIATITQKYLSALDEMQALNLDIAGEFLVMAATLAEIKSKMLLPKEEQKQDSEEEEGEDPRQGLINRLIAYQQFKEASRMLAERSHEGRDLFFRLATDPEPDAQVSDTLAEREIKPIDLFTLAEEFAKVLKKSQIINIHTITRDRITVSARMHELIDFCQVRHRFSFYDALKFFPIYEKIDVIVTFLALLEMSRLKLIRLARDEQEDLVLTIDKNNFYSKHQEILDNLTTKDGQVNYD